MRCLKLNVPKQLQVFLQFRLEVRPAAEAQVQPHMKP